MATNLVVQSEPKLSPALLPLLRELGELKRIYSAGRTGSIAARLFADGWKDLIGSKPTIQIALGITSRALAATRIGDLDIIKLGELGLDMDRTIAIQQVALDEVAGPLDARLTQQLQQSLYGEQLSTSNVPPFVALLSQQPRAGVTCPGKPRLMLQPAENHAEHSLIVAVYAVLLSPFYGADPAASFLAGMAHHLHSAAMPDSGYAGEILLGDDLLPVMAKARQLAMAQLPAALQEPIEHAILLIADDAAPEAKAFHAADAIDRVLETEQHLRSREATMRSVLDDYGLVHDGPVKPFHDRVLAEIGLG